MFVGRPGSYIPSLSPAMTNGAVQIQQGLRKLSHSLISFSLAAEAVILKP